MTCRSVRFFFHPLFIPGSLRFTGHYETNGMRSVATNGKRRVWTVGMKRHKTRDPGSVVNMRPPVVSILVSRLVTLSLSLLFGVLSFSPPSLRSSGSDGEEHTRREKGDECVTSRTEPGAGWKEIGGYCHPSVVCSARDSCPFAPYGLSVHISLTSLVTTSGSPVTTV